MSTKDKVLVLNSILYVTIFMMMISAILKFMGVNEFALDVENEIVKSISYFLENHTIIDYLLKTFTLYLNYFIIFKLSCHNPNKKIYHLFAINLALLNAIVQINLSNSVGPLLLILYFVFSVVTFLVPCWLIDKKIRIKKPLLVMILIIIYQILVLFIRNITWNGENEPLYNFLLNFDFIILLLMTYYLHLKSERRDFKCGQEAYSFSDLKTSLKKLQKNYRRFLSKSKQRRAETIIYIILSILWELFTLTILLFVAFLNDTLIECMFILSSFVITKKVFGTPFHFRSASACFIVSNLTFYALNRITFTVGISFIVPVSLGILLAYGTSKLVKRSAANLYRGMSVEEFDVACGVRLSDLEKDILQDYYCNRMNMVALSLKYHYSEKSIYNIRRNGMVKLKINS